jgi:hypothetical protein
MIHQVSMIATKPTLEAEATPATPNVIRSRKGAKLPNSPWWCFGFPPFAQSGSQASLGERLLN